LERMIKMSEKITMVFEKDERYSLTSPQDSLPYLSSIQKKQQEHFMVLFLDGAHRIIGKKIVTKGLVNRTVVHPREVFREAIKKNSTAIILAHNHPSGSLVVSPEDKEVTDRLIKAGEIIGISVLDHVIIAKTGHKSMREEGLI
jgi:DNA repair protein RadC